MDELTFYKRYIQYCDEGGHSYHGGDIEWAWHDYLNNPDNYEHLYGEGEDS